MSSSSLYQKFRCTCLIPMSNIILFYYSLSPFVNPLYWIEWSRLTLIKPKKKPRRNNIKCSNHKRGWGNIIWNDKNMRMYKRNNVICFLSNYETEFYRNDSFLLFMLGRYKNRSTKGLLLIKMSHIVFWYKTRLRRTKDGWPVKTIHLKTSIITPRQINSSKSNLDFSTIQLWLVW